MLSKRLDMEPWILLFKSISIFSTEGLFISAVPQEKFNIRKKSKMSVFIDDVVISKSKIYLVLPVIYGDLKR
jgi:hypothetical protein